MFGLPIVRRLSALKEQRRFWDSGVVENLYERYNEEDEAREMIFRQLDSFLQGETIFGIMM